MGIKKCSEKLNEYFERLDNKKADRIKKSHVEKVIRKLEAKRDQLTADRDSASKPSKKERLQSKINVANEQIERANWLLKEIT